MSDIQYFDDLYADFEHLVAADSQRGSLSATARERSVRRRSRQRAVRFAVVASICLTATALGVSLERSLSTQTQSAALDLRASEPAPAPPPTLTGRAGSEPTLGLGYSVWKPRLHSFYSGHAEAVTLAQARRLAGFQVAAPDSPLASDAMIRKVWFLPLFDQTLQNAVALEYPHLEVVEQRMPSTYIGPRVYRAMVREHSDPHGAVFTVNNVPAYVAPPYTDAQGAPHPGYVLFTKSGIQTRLEAYYSAQQLISIAESMY